MLFAAQQFGFSSILAYFKCVHEQLQVIFVIGVKYYNSVYFCSVASQPL